MSTNYELRVVRVDDFVAESLGRFADGMPPSYAEQANSLRAQAKTLRNSSSTNTVRMWEETPATFQRTVDQELPRR
jgi:hypothetical protein